MTIIGRKGFYRRKRPDRKRIEDGKEVVIQGVWDKIFAKVAPEADDVYIPVALQGTELDMRKYLGSVSEERAWGIVSGLQMWRLKDLTLQAKNCRMVDLPGQRVSFMRKGLDKDITKPEDQHKVILPGKKEKHFGRIGFDVAQVYIPIIEESGARTNIRIESFMFEEKSKGDK
ncbi:unnamed protein product [marine sediment metagenome]|uniref:Uncharacterized protein n=1 Tax=marine sediment metagenome TaxID=412755 RepID=X1KK66_9ZZZZ